MMSDRIFALFLVLLILGAVLMGIGGIFHLDSYQGSIIKDPLLFQLGSISFLAGLAVAIAAIFLLYKLGRSR